MKLNSGITAAFLLLFACVFTLKAQPPSKKFGTLIKQILGEFQTGRYTDLYEKEFFNQTHSKVSKKEVNKKGRNGKTLLHEAFSNSPDFHWVLFLLESGANPNARDDSGDTPLHYIKNDAYSESDNPMYGSHYIECILLLLNYGADINAKNLNGETPLLGLLKFISAPRVNRDVMVRVLLEHGAAVNVQSKEEGFFPLLFASFFGNHNVEMLIKFGANVNLKSTTGYTALMFHAAFGSYYDTKRLIRAGANVNAQDAEGNTAAMYCVLQAVNWRDLKRQNHHSSLPIIKELIRAGADINKQNKDGLTLIMMAAARGDVPVFEHLLKIGANTTLRTYGGKDARYYAIESGHRGILYLLKKYKNPKGAVR